MGTSVPTIVAGSPMHRAAIIIAVLLVLAVVVVLDTGADQPADARAEEPYAPFRMTYVTADADGTSTTIEVTWRGRHSWTAELKATSGDSRHIGRTVMYDGSTLTIDDPLLGVDSFSAGGADAVGAVPDRWLIARELSAGDGWTALGVGPDGYERFERTLVVADERITTSYRRDPASGIVMGFSESVDGRQVTSVEVVRFEILPTSEAASAPDQSIPSPDPEPQPGSTAE